MQAPAGMLTPTLRFMLMFAATVIIIAGLKASADMIAPFILSSFIVVISGPPLFWLRRRGVPTGLAITLVMLLIISMTAGVAAIVSSSLAGFSAALPDYRNSLQNAVSNVFAWLGLHGIDLTASWVMQYLDPSTAMDLAANTVSGFGNVLTNSFLILLTVIFMLLEVSSFPNKLSALSRDPERTMARYQRFIDTLKDYMAMKTLMSLLTGFGVTLWLWGLGVDFAALWGLLAFFLNYVPNIGSIIAAVPAVLLAFVQLGSSSALLAAAGYVFLNTVIGNFIEPRLMGRGLGLSTLVVFLSLVFWGWVLGPVGMLLSVPLTMTLKIALEGNEETRWLAVILGSERDYLLPAEPHPANPEQQP
ncbi:AI-2E family transporter [Granulosicoccaceae sp. 1_MG-2023]|nr:AI-2E family transporter [Granulosicoccaceae sp. 1_MG-2023]